MLSKEDILSNLTNAIDRPVSEVFVQGFDFSDYRLSYGVHCQFPSTVYFIAIYPAFCLNPKAVFHYNTIEAMQNELNTILDFVVDAEESPSGSRKTQTRDIIAVVFALSRNKESIELFQEQKDFMELGVQHVHLDNFYQDFIKLMCQEYFNHGTLRGKPLKLSFLTEDYIRGTNGKA